VFGVVADKSDYRRSSVKVNLIVGGLNDKDAAIAAGYSVSVAENTKQRI
jgi:hypothetical protein